MLRVEDASVRFGGVQALDGVSLSAPPGIVTGLIGPNGAGKTTLFNAISGLQHVTRGSVWLGETDVTSYGPTRRARLGLARTFQRLEVFGTMTARQNVLVAAELASRRGTGASPTTVTAALLDRLGLTAVADVQADTLPTGLARLVELARALAAQPSVLLLDEPSSGLNTVETDTMGDLLVELAGDGLAILLVEHDVELVMRVCRTVFVLDFGQVIATGPPAEVQADPAVRLAYLGTEAHASDQAGSAAEAAPGTTAGTDAAVVARPAEPDVPAPAALELRGIHAGYGQIEVLHDVSLTVPSGTVFALLGANGAGKSSTIRVASGRLHPTRGEVWFAGQKVTGRSPERLAKLGLCTVPEGRAVFPNLTVAENLQMWTFKDRTPRATIEERAYGWFPILGDRRRQIAGTLSGGEQQMLAMSRALTTEPRLLLLDELSAGLAPLVVAELYDAVAKLAEGGISIVVVEQSVRSALSIADRVAVVANGRIVAEGSPDDLESSIEELYLGSAGPPAQRAG